MRNNDFAEQLAERSFASASHMDGRVKKLEKRIELVGNKARANKLLKPFTVPKKLQKLCDMKRSFEKQQRGYSA